MKINDDIIQRIVAELMGKTKMDSISLSSDVRKDLCVCALISASWLSAARRELWRQFVVPNCNGRSFDRMVVTFSSPYSTLPSAIRELVYDHSTSDWISSHQGPSRFFEWLGSPAHPGTNQTNLQCLSEVRSFSLWYVELIYPEDDEDGESNRSSLSPAATTILLHSFDVVTTFKLKAVEILSIGQLSEIIHAFPRLVELHLIQVRFSSQQRFVYENISVSEDCETSQPDSRSGCSSTPLLQTFRFHEAGDLDALPFSQLPLIISLHPLVYNVELVIFLSDQSLSAISQLLGHSSVQHVELKELEVDPFVDENGQITFGEFLTLRPFNNSSESFSPARSVNHGLSPFSAVRGLRSFTLELVNHEQYIPFLLGLPHDALKTLILLSVVSKFPWPVGQFGTSEDRLKALDSTIHRKFPTLNSLKFNVDTFIHPTNTSLWNAWKAAKLSQDEFRTPVIEEGLLWETSQAKYNEIADRLPLCKKEGWLKPLFNYIEADEDEDFDNIIILTSLLDPSNSPPEGEEVEGDNGSV
ncbi:hypothetical protein PQX77_015777 [Marasmius sp. AFHP31]|nr:hypothetical protein PQX77_015777 [Marasmius sp. AFHP31]